MQMWKGPFLRVQKRPSLAVPRLWFIPGTLQLHTSGLASSSCFMARNEKNSQGEKKKDWFKGRRLSRQLVLTGQSNAFRLCTERKPWTESCALDQSHSHLCEQLPGPPRNPQLWPSPAPLPAGQGQAPVAQPRPSVARSSQDHRDGAVAGGRTGVHRVPQGNCETTQWPASGGFLASGLESSRWMCHLEKRRSLGSWFTLPLSSGEEPGLGLSPVCPRPLRKAAATEGMSLPKSQPEKSGAEGRCQAIVHLLLGQTPCVLCHPHGKPFLLCRVSRRASSARPQPGGPELRARSREGTDSTQPDRSGAGACKVGKAPGWAAVPGCGCHFRGSSRLGASVSEDIRAGEPRVDKRRGWLTSGLESRG